MLTSTAKSLSQQKKLIAIYGPPASGKLTIGKVLKEKTGSLLFHNHIIFDLAMNFYSYGTSEFDHFKIDLTRYVLDKHLLRGNNNIIYTFCYDKNKDDSEARYLLDACKKHRYKPYFIQLKCDLPALKTRIVDESRKGFGKIQDLEAFHENIKSKNFFSHIDFIDNSLVVDTTKLTPSESSLKIIETVGF